MKSTAYYWLHMLPFIVVMGLSLTLMVVSLVLSVLPGRRPYWLALLLTGLFGGLLFVSPPFRMLSHAVPVGQMSWARLNEAAALLLRDTVRLDSATSAWVPEFLAG